MKAITSVQSDYKSLQTRLSRLQSDNPPLNMLEFIKNSIIGSRLFQRTSSMEVNSKFKRSISQKKPFSFDSKQKQQKDALMTSQRQQRPEVIIQDQTMTIKKFSCSKVHESRSNMNQDFSDIDDGWHDPQKQKKTLAEHSQLIIEDFSHRPNNLEFKQEGIQLKESNVKKSALMKSSIFPQLQNSGKILISRKRSAIKLKKVGQKCVVCSKNLNIGDSFQLACSHRCHKECGIQMQWRMRYDCDACQIKKDRNRCSIILSTRRRNGKA